MKNQISNRKSKTIHLIAACVILAAFGPPAAELARAQGHGRGSPPGPIDATFTLPGGVICGFDVQVDVSGRSGVISLPGGDLFITGPAVFATLTNLSDPSKSVTLNLTGPGRYSTDENGNTTVQAYGRWLHISPSFGMKLGIGDFTFLLDQNGNLIQGPTGNGQLVDVCEMLE